MDNNSEYKIFSLTENLQRLKNLLIENDLEEAEDLVTKADILVFDKRTVCKEAIEYLQSIEEYPSAVKVAEFGNIYDENTKEIYRLEYRKLLKNRNYIEAADWGDEHGLSETEITRAASSAFTNMIENNLFEVALKTFDKYKLKKEDHLGMVISVFTKALEENNYMAAALLGKKFQLSKEKTIDSAYKVYRSELNSAKFEDALYMAKKFGLFKKDSIELLSEEDGKKIMDLTFEKYLVPVIEENNLEAVKRFYDSLYIWKINSSNDILKVFKEDFYNKIVEKHNSLLNPENLSKAIDLKDKLELTSCPMPEYLLISLIEETECFHNKLLEEGDYRQAENMKHSYGLYENNPSHASLEMLYKSLSILLLKITMSYNFELVKAIIKEYKIPKEYSNRSLLLGVMNLLDKGNIDEAFKVQGDFDIEIYDEESRLKVMSKFVDMKNLKDYRTAISIAEKFNLGENYISDTEYKFWEYRFNLKKYEEAYNIFREFKIPRKKTKDLAMAHYHLRKVDKEIYIASEIRKTYRLPIGLLEIITEIITKLFFTGSQKTEY